MCAEELTREDIQATCEGCKSAKGQDVSYVAVLNLTSCSHPPVNLSPLAIAHSEQVKSKREDPVIGELIKFKE